MPKKKSRDSVESFCFTLDHWCREYGFELNRQPWAYSPDHPAAGDAIIIAGRERSNTRRNISSGQLHRMPSYVPRDILSEDADHMGNSWLKGGRLYCVAFIPSDAYWSLAPRLAAGTFVAISVRVKSLHYNKGQTDAVRLCCTLSEIDAEGCCELAATLAQVSMGY